MPGNFVKGDRKFMDDLAIATSLVIVTAVCIVFMLLPMFVTASMGFSVNSLQHFCLITLGIVSLCTLALVTKIMLEIFVAIHTINSLFSTSSERCTLRRHGACKTGDGP
ncbi:hypothetical protein ANPL_04490 [Anaplasma platys]|uniref:Uncharacterized protein n=1 Tax=Anaplasma platys TaxID=949 RepID=A0A858PZA5_9RICK|nr:hypothetical protein ANPL_04490 [Anaplasma platys]